MQQSEAATSGRDLAAQVIEDMQIFFQQQGGESKALPILAQRSEISERTLTRYLNKEVMPQRKALKRLYEALTGAQNEEELQQRIPDVIFERVFCKVPLSRFDRCSYYLNLNQEFMNNSIFRSLYLKSIFGPFYKEEAVFRFGEEGKEVIKQMLRQEVLDIDTEGRLISGKKRISIDSDSFKVMALDLLQKHFYPEKSAVRGENGHTWGVSSLNLKGYNALLQANLEFLQKKIEIIHNPEYSGEMKVWSISTVDTMTDEKIYKGEWEAKR